MRVMTIAHCGFYTTHGALQGALQVALQGALQGPLQGAPVRGAVRRAAAVRCGRSVAVVRLRLRCGAVSREASLAGVGITSAADSLKNERSLVVNLCIFHFASSASTLSIVTLLPTVDASASLSVLSSRCAVSSSGTSV